MRSEIQISWLDPDELELASQKGATLPAKVEIDGKTYVMTFITYQNLENSIDYNKQRYLPFCPTRRGDNLVVVPMLSIECIRQCVEYLATFKLIPDSWLS